MKTIAGAAGLFAGIIGSNQVLEEHVEKLLTGEAESSVPISLPLRRALFVTLGQSEGISGIETLVWFMLTLNRKA